MTRNGIRAHQFPQSSADLNTFPPSVNQELIYASWRASSKALSLFVLNTKPDTRRKNTRPFVRRMYSSEDARYLKLGLIHVQDERGEESYHLQPCIHDDSCRFLHQLYGPRFLSCMMTYIHRWYARPQPTTRRYPCNGGCNGRCAVSKPSSAAYLFIP